jgi:hypothetical protein
MAGYHCFAAQHTATNTNPSPRVIVPKAPDYEAMRPFLGWLPTDIVKATFERTTQYARMPMSTFLNLPSMSTAATNPSPPTRCSPTPPLLMVGRSLHRSLLVRSPWSLTLKE